MNTTTTARLGVTAGVIMLGVLTGCQQPAGYDPSGWLDDYPPLVPSNRVRGAYVWLHDTRVISDYDTFILDAVTVMVGPESRRAGIQQADLDHLASFFQQEISAQIMSSGKYRIVSNPGPGVLRIRSAITGVNASTATPATPKPGAGLGGANLEAEFIDTGTNERIAVVIASQQGNRYKPQRNKLSHTEDVLAYWAKILREALDNRWISRESPW